MSQAVLAALEQRQYADVPLGSRWYEAGHHWEVIEHTTWDGEAAVRIRCLTGSRRPRTEHLLAVRRLLRRGVRQDNGSEPAASAPEQGRSLEARNRPEEGTMPEATAEAQPEAPSAEELDQQIAALSSEMEPHREGYMRYEKAHAALRDAEAKRKAKGPHQAVKDETREAHKVYWRLYNQRQALKKQRKELYGDPPAAEAEAPTEA